MKQKQLGYMLPVYFVIFYRQSFPSYSPGAQVLKPLPVYDDVTQSLVTLDPPGGAAHVYFGGTARFPEYPTMIGDSMFCWFGPEQPMRGRGGRIFQNVVEDPP